MTSKDLLNMPDVSNVGNIDDDNERVKTIVLSFLYERKNLGRTTVKQIKERIGAMVQGVVEMNIRDLFLDNNWIDFSAQWFFCFVIAVTSTLLFLYTHNLYA